MDESTPIHCPSDCTPLAKLLDVLFSALPNLAYVMLAAAGVIYTFLCLVIPLLACRAATKKTVYGCDCGIVSPEKLVLVVVVSIVACWIGMAMII